MDIIGKVSIAVLLDGMQTINHEFIVLNNSSCNILLGRDFMRLFRVIKFDFCNNRVQIGNRWFNGVSLNKKLAVRVNEATTIKPRSEQVLLVRCDKNASLVPVDFEPNKLRISGLFVTRARVVPNSNGLFKITAMNTTEGDINLKSRAVIGTIQDAAPIIGKIDRSNMDV